MKRKTGYYWVKLKRKWVIGFWEILKIEEDDLSSWFLVFDENVYKDEDFAEIDERKIERNDTN